LTDVQVDMEAFLQAVDEMDWSTEFAIKPDGELKR
jgi:hypothetical protein